MNQLLQIKIIDETTGKKYQLLGFTSKGDDRSGLYVDSVTLYDPETRTGGTVNDVTKMKRLTIIKE